MNAAVTPKHEAASRKVQFQEDNPKVSSELYSKQDANRYAEHSQAVASKSSVTDLSVRRANQNFERLYGQRLEATLIGEDDIDTTDKNVALTSVTNDLSNLLKKSQKIAAKENSKVYQQLSVNPQTSLG